MLRNDFEGAAHPRMDAAEVGVLADRKVRRRRRDEMRRADRLVDGVDAQAEDARVPDAVGERVVRDVRAVARPRTGRDRVPDAERAVLVDELQRGAVLDLY